MSDMAYQAPGFAGLAKGFALNGAQSNANFHFSRQDGPANISFGGELSPEAALKLDVFLRDLLIEDAPVMAAQRAQLEKYWEAQKLANYRQQQEYAQLNVAGQIAPSGWDG